MKKIYSSIVSTGAAILLVSCSNVLENGVELQQSNAPVINATQESPSRSSITVDGEGVGTIYWSPSDEISVFYGASTPVLYTSTNTAPETTAAFTTTAIIGSTELASTNIWGLYPHNPSAVCDGSSITTTLPAVQHGISGTFDDDLFLTVAHSDDTNLHFYNVCGGIKFSLSRDDITSITFSGNNNEDIAGDITVSFIEGLPSVSVVNGVKTITLTPKDGSTFAANTDYYLIAIPQSLSNGFTMTFETGSQIGTFNYTAKAVTLKRSVFSKKVNIDGYASFDDKPSPPTVIDLSVSGTANCYIVPSSGQYKFNASVKGNSTESVGTPASAEVLWETFGTNVVPSVGDLVYSVSLQDGYVHFSATDTKGNALIAVKDSEGTILWSWHIWKTEIPAEQVYYNNAGIMMDRNLGATSVLPGDIKSYGVVYQWGRKDPFLGSSSTSSYISVGSTATMKEIYCSATTGTVEYSIKHPDTIIKGHTDLANYIADYCWLWDDYKTILSAGLWAEQKTKYDPCPNGWIVPTPDVWTNILGSETITDIPWDGINSGVDFGISSSYPLGEYSSIWYPCTGIKGGADGVKMQGVGKRTAFWTTEYSRGDNWVMPSTFEVDYDYTKFVGKSRNNTSSGRSVRCEKM